MIKKGVLGIIMVVIAIFLVGCLNYKAYDIPKEESTEDEANLVNEIAAVEEEISALNTEETAEPIPETEEVEVEELTQEVTIPEVDDTQKPVVAEGDLEVITVKENELVRLKVRVDDPDKDKVTYTYSKPLAKTGEWKTNYGDAGEYIITLTATDGKLTTEKRVKLVVQRVNVPPVIEPIKDLLVKEGEVVTLEPKVADPNKDNVSITTSEPLKSGKFATDHTSAGQYQIKVVASDGELEAEEEFTLTVQDVNVLPEVAGVVENMTVKEGEVVEIKPIVTDLDGDVVTVTISDPVGDDGVWETGYTSHGSYVVTVSVSDGKDTVLKRVNLLVRDVNMAPEITDIYVENN